MKAEYGFRVEIVDREPRFFNQLGWRVPAVPASPPPAQLGSETIERMNAPLAITPMTNALGWRPAELRLDRPGSLSARSALVSAELPMAR